MFFIAFRKILSLFYMSHCYKILVACQFCISSTIQLIVHLLFFFLNWNTMKFKWWKSIWSSMNEWNSTEVRLLISLFIYFFLICEINLLIVNRFYGIDLLINSEKLIYWSILSERLSAHLWWVNLLVRQ